MRRIANWASILALAGAPACEFFEGDDDEFGEDTGSETEGGEDDPGPTRGSRVFPKFMLQDVPAIVTIERPGELPEACALDDAPEGGYVCDADLAQAGSDAILEVQRDGFEPALRTAEVSFNQIVPLEVHLAVEGGPNGVWSACTPAAELASCDELCATAMSSCMVTSCASAQEQAPIATYEVYADPECLELEHSEALACDAALPVGEAVYLRCCCAS